jgi:hypothetical protein
MATTNFTYTIFETLVTKVDNYQTFISYLKNISLLLKFCYTDEFCCKMLVWCPKLATCWKTVEIWAHEDTWKFPNSAASCSLKTWSPGAGWSHNSRFCYVYEYNITRKVCRNFAIWEFASFVKKKNWMYLYKDE